MSDTNEKEAIESYMRLLTGLDNGPLEDGDLIHLLFAMAHGSFAQDAVTSASLHCIAVQIGVLAGMDAQAITDIHTSALSDDLEDPRVKRLQPFLMRLLVATGRIMVVDSAAEMAAVLEAMQEPVDKDKLN